MKIFNEMIKVNDKEMMIIYDKFGDVWFGLRDLLKILGYVNFEKANANIKVSKQNKIIYSKMAPF